MGVEFLTGQRLTADLINANVVDYLPVTYTKISSESRNTTTTLANDAELAGIPLGVGTWEIELLLYFTLTTTATQKIKTRWAMTGGTWNGSAGIRACYGPGSANTVDVGDAATVSVRGFTLDTQDATYDANATSAYSAVRELSRTVTVTVAGSLSFQWAQSASSGNNTNVQGGSTFTIRKISD